MPTPEPPKIARPAGQQPPESGGIPAPTVSADPPSSSSSNPAPPAVTNGLAPGAPLVNGGAGNPSGERPASVPVSAVPASGISSASNTSTSFPSALKVVLLPDHLRQNQAGPSTGAGGQPRPSTGAGSPLPSPASPAMMKTVAVTIGNPLPVARASTATVQRITVSSKTPQLSQTTVPLLQNFQVPAGMVLVRSDSGQLVLVPQKVIAQAKARAQVHGTGNTSSAAPISAPTVRISTVQATGTQRVPNQVKPPTVQHMNQLQAGVQTSTAAQRITVVQTMSGTIAPKSVSTVAQKQASASADRSATVPVVQTSASPETLENVKKCKNFLATLIKLASSGSHSPQMSNNVKALVQKLLDGMMEVEEFTNQLYKELKSSPQPYLVPFLKRSLPALRKLMPNSQAFIQQCLQKPAAPAATLAAVSGASKQANPGQVTKTITVTSATQQAKVLQSLSSPQMATQQSGVLTKSQASTLPRTQTVTLQRPPNHVVIPLSQNQVKEVQTSAATSVTKVTLAQMNRNVLLQASSGQIIKQEFGGSTFRDEDDINDVASMAGVNITEENARILATNSELVGAIIRSCKDEAFLSSVSLQKKTLEIGKKHGVTEVNSDVLSTISHATQEHLRELVEKLTVIAQHRMMTHKDDDRYSLLNDTRSQLKFFEQLDQLEKQRKDEDERETMLRLAKSRAKHEDPEQLRLKQRAKEMQQLELAQLQQREANLAALAAIGPRKRKTPDSPGLRTGNEGLSSSGGALGLRATQARPYLRQRVTRVNLRDLILCLEQDQAMKHSLFLYRAYLK
ncbi:transcription initiation factor TFIID subunit 4-like isoform X2 [Heterodontus francisci]|uniref:transcription initiation factor TFIID subunit 4-like isoform X2 n=1 Tax=Heterodontus francisci TaxID=7792 RepID=UPI00355ADB32